jgi:uncharacterized protein (DUF1800 family)
MKARHYALCAGAAALFLSVAPAVQTAPSADKNGIPGHPDDKAIVHVLNRLGFGPAPGDVDRIRRVGLEKYIEQQLRPEQIPDTAITARLAPLETLTKSSRELADEYFMPAQMERRRVQQQQQQTPAPPGDTPPDRREMRTPEQMQLMQAERGVFTDLAQQKILRAAYSERQLNEVMVDFWFNHFNVFAGKGQVRAYLTEYERDVIRPNVFAHFRDLLGATAHSPAMLFYLDNWQSAAPEGAATSAPMNRPRFTPGAVRGRKGMPRTIADVPPGAQQRRPRGLNENYARELMELHTLGVDGGYTQKDVQEVARAFTGWTIANPRQGGGFRFEPRMHDDGEKIVLGHRIKAGGGERDAEDVLDILASHPSTARFIATKLVRRFVADAPPAPLVDRAAARFSDSHGDIREVVRTIVTSPEFFAPAAYRAKVRTPFEFVAASVRAAGIDVVNAMPLVQTLRELGMPPYQCQPPTGYADRADAWVNTGGLLNRMNFAVALTGGRMRAVRTTAATPLASAEAARTTLIDEVLAGDVSGPTRSTVDKASTAPQAIALLLGSPEFQKR